MNVALDKKRVIVTGGASGIGFAIAEAFAAEGANVHVCDINAAAIASVNKMGRFAGLTCDLSDTEAVRAYMETATAALGGLDVLVNNAGVAGPTGAAEDLDLAEWKRTIDVNLASMFNVTQHAIPHLKRAGAGAIVNLSSAAGRLGLPMRTPYSASKWGVVGMTKTLAMELGASAITVNAILPGAVDGPRLQSIIHAKAAETGVEPQEIERQILAAMSIKKLVQPSAIGALAVFLASALAASISGQAVGIDGDLQCMV